jgi:hypothetical protein
MDMLLVSQCRCSRGSNPDFWHSFKYTYELELVGRFLMEFGLQLLTARCLLSK